MRRRVLVADDDPISCELLSAALARWGYDVVTTSDGLETWALLEEETPDVLLLDWQMPGLDGPTLCRLVRADPERPYCYILFVTSRDGKSDVVEALDAGADDFLSKPYDLAELRARVEAGTRVMQHAATFRPPPSPRRSAASTPISPRRSRESDGSPRMLGTIVAGKYVVSRLIGTGGMGTVWEAIHLRLRTRVAIKFMQADRAANAGLRKRFEIEAKAAGRLSTRHAVKIFDYGVTDCGRPYIVMEYLSGGSLAQAIAERGPLSAREVALIVRQAARALAEAHAAGIVHRDIKPDNVFLAEEGDDTQSELPYTTKIVDFGIASVMRTDLKARGPNGESVRKVGPATDGTLVGTPHFMSPEQLTLGGPPTPQDDVWALAACTFMALTGKAPFDGATLGDVVLAVCTRPLPVPSKVWPGVPKGFDELFERTCSREPEKRFQTALELADALGALCGLPPRAAPQLSLRRTTIRLEAEAPPESWPTLRAPSVKPPEPPPERPRRKSAALIALTMIVVLLFGAWLGWARPGPGARAELTEGDPG